MRTIAAWSVHLLTASGIVCCLFALEATYQSQWRTALLWLLVAVIIDAVDGTVARAARVKSVLPHFDGTLLDNLVDYANYVIVPALIIHRAEVLPSQVSFAAAAAICLASAYQFCQIDAKTPDHYFKGFPSYWNIVALYLIAYPLNPWISATLIAVLVVLVFVPIRYIYVTRTRPLRRWTFPLTAVWTVMAVAIVWQLPEPNAMLVELSALYFVYYAGASVYLTAFAGGEG